MQRGAGSAFLPSGAGERVKCDGENGRGIARLERVVIHSGKQLGGNELGYFEELFRNPFMNLAASALISVCLLPLGWWINAIFTNRSTRRRKQQLQRALQFFVQGRGRLNSGLVTIHLMQDVFRALLMSGLCIGMLMVVSIPQYPSQSADETWEIVVEGLFRFGGMIFGFTVIFRRFYQVERAFKDVLRPRHRAKELIALVKADQTVFPRDTQKELIAALEGIVNTPVSADPGDTQKYYTQIRAHVWTSD